jgi:hypothetical protein
MKILLKCFIMAIECGRPFRCKYYSLCFVVNVIHFLCMGVLCVIWHKGVKAQNFQLKKLDLKNKRGGLI